MAILVQYNNAGIKFPIDKPRIRIGRGIDNEICIDDDLVSKEHAVIEVVLISEKDARVEYVLQDLDSTNHTYVNDKRISLYKLANGDVIRIGMNNFRFVDESDGALDETSKLYRTWIPGVFYTGSKKK
ncbi:MAG TPA: FHA domain-containing protein [Gammaproteobacteria bacterium]|nr:FHA domain-containing protein [Gammaproteobacteria bacterium]